MLNRFNHNREIVILDLDHKDKNKVSTYFMFVSSDVHLKDLFWRMG